MSNRKVFNIIPLLLLAGCAVTGPADDGYDNQNEWVDNGRLLSDDARTIYSSDKTGGAENPQHSPQSAQATAAAEYADYQQWLNARENNSAEYQKFQRWQEFEDFKIWQGQQKEKQKPPTK